MKPSQAPHFKLKEPKSEQETSIRLFVFHSNFPHRRFVYGLKKSILPELWDEEAQRPTTNRKLIKEYEKHLPEISDSLRNITTLLSQVDGYVNSYFTMKLGNKTEVSALSLKDYLDQNIYPKVEPVNKIKTETLNEYIERFISELERGVRLNKGRVFQEGSIKNYKTFQSQFNAYQKERKRKVNFNDVTSAFYDDFVKFLNDKDYKINSVGKHIARIKAIMRSAMEETIPLHSNTDFQKKSFIAFSEPFDEVYLTKSELIDITNADLSAKPHLELYRDIFLIGCYTAQRVSDYNNIKQHNVINLDNGKKALKIYQKKTKEDVIIPIKKELDAIFKKYNYEPPRVKEQNLNDAIKDICEIAKINQMIEIESVVGGKQVKTIKPKCKWVTSHTARRTGATLMYKDEIKPIDIMKITGHKKESTFINYIKLSKEETANILSNHKYFD